MSSTDNARIRVIDADKDITAEMIAQQVILTYDAGNPVGGGVAFHAFESLFIAGQYQSMTGKFEAITVNIADILAECFLPAGTLDPVTGIDVSGVSVATVGMIVKAAFDACYNKQVREVKAFEERMAAALADHPDTNQAAVADAPAPLVPADPSQFPADEEAP